MVERAPRCHQNRRNSTHRRTLKTHPFRLTWPTKNVASDFNYTCDFHVLRCQNDCSENCHGCETGGKYNTVSKLPELHRITSWSPPSLFAQGHSVKDGLL